MCLGGTAKRSDDIVMSTRRHILSEAEAMRNVNPMAREFGLRARIAVGMSAVGRRVAIEAPLRQMIENVSDDYNRVCERMRFLSGLADERNAEIERLRIENAVLTAQLETLLNPAPMTPQMFGAVPDDWIVTEGPKDLLP